MNWHDWLNVGAITLSLASLVSVAVMSAHRRRRERGFPMPSDMHVQLTPEQMARVNRIGPVLDDGRVVHHSREHEHTLADEISVRAWHEREQRAYDMETQIRSDAAELMRHAPERTIVQTYADLLNRLDTPGGHGLEHVTGGPKHAIADPLRDKHIRVTGEPTHGVGARGPGQKFPKDPT